ncbi:MAG TPA: ABC-F family ATP-binding cassette domain-containing protein [Pseudolysinimonas sp.]|nr:ABC-F family ATP-binding cassette domain-containing protein [Pseudolysinimonas sp.]
MHSSTSLLRADGISHAYGDRPVLTDLSLTVSGGQRLGLLGENGAGKSTLLRLLAGAETPDAGVIERPARTALLAQEVAHDPAVPIRAIIDDAVADLHALEAELQDAAAALGGDDASAEMRYAKALEAAEAAELWTLDSRQDELLDGLGVGGLPLDRPIGEISGGQRSRVALAALLLARPDALLLDEPTNHLDDSAVAFLVSRLRDWRGAVVFASHDRAFLDEVASGLLDIDPSRAGATRFGGNYSDYLQAKAATRMRWEAQFAAEEKEVAALGHAVNVTARALDTGAGPRDNDKFLYDFKGGNIDRQVRRRVRNAQGRLENLLAERVDEPAPLLSFAGIPTGSQVLDDTQPLLTVDHARVGDRLSLDRLTIAPDSRLLVTGPNGAGKSTLLGLLAGRLTPDSGRVARRKGLRVALLDQDVRWTDPSATPRGLYARALGEKRAESFPLAGLGLLAERDLDRPVGRLSIGQQRRTALALIIAKPPHVFLLDEPTNHLSLALATELEDALGTYPGAVVVASHDRWLRRRWSSPTLRLLHGTAA